MKRKLTKEQAASVAAKVLINIFVEDINAVANIVNAEALVKEGNDEGYSTLCDALAAARDFLQDLINDILMGKKTTKGHCGECCWFVGEDSYGFGMCAKIFAELSKCEDECHEDHFVSREEMRYHLAVLLLYNRWRRSDQPTGFYKMPDPKEVGKAVDFAINYIKTFMEV